MSRLLSRAVRLLKFGAAAGIAVGVGRVVVRRRHKTESGESSWPTIAETAAQNGHPVDDAVDNDDGAGDDTTGDDTHDGEQN